MKSALLRITAIAVLAVSLSGCIIISREVVDKRAPTTETSAAAPAK